MSTTTAYLSAEEYLLLPADEPNELVRGELRPVTFGTWTHTRVATNAFVLPRAYVEPRRLIDPHRRTLEVHAPDAPVRRLRDGDTLDGTPLLPDFRCAVAELFEGLAAPERPAR